MKTTRVLLIDDNPDRLKLLTRLLADRYVVSSYGSAAAALRELETATTDVLLLMNTAPMIDHRGLVSMIETVLAHPGTGPPAV